MDNKYIEEFLKANYTMPIYMKYVNIFSIKNKLYGPKDYYFGKLKSDLNYSRLLKKLRKSNYISRRFNL